MPKTLTDSTITTHGNRILLGFFLVCENSPWFILKAGFSLKKSYENWRDTDLSVWIISEKKCKCFSRCKSICTVILFFQNKLRKIPKNLKIQEEKFNLSISRMKQPMEQFDSSKNIKFHAHVSSKRQRNIKKVYFLLLLQY